MPTNLTGQSIASTYGQLLHVDGGATSTRKTVVDGDGTSTALKVATTSAAVAGEFVVEGANPLKLADSDSSHSIALKAPTTVASDVVLTLPDNAGVNGQVLRTNGAGVLSWADLSGAFTSILDTQTFNDNGTWTKPAQGTVAIVRCWGGGGSGGKGGAADQLGGGGGGGAFTETYVALSDLPSTVTVTVGLGGAAVTANSTNGNAGGNTTFGTYAAAYGGGGGGRSAGTTSGSGGAGGGGGGADAAGTTATNLTTGSAVSGGAGSLTTLKAVFAFIGINVGASPPVSVPLGGASSTYITRYGGAGASYLGTVNCSTTFAGQNSEFGGASGGAGQTSGGTSNAGGNSTWGGGGGGGACRATPAGSAGTSTYGGNGGAGAFDANTAGSGVAPGGGGGGAETGTSGAGAKGRVIVYVV